MLLRLLDEHEVEYLLVGGIAVALHGYPRDFQACAPRAVPQSIGGTTVPVIGLEDLKANKLASGRNKDLDDLGNLP